MITGKLTMHKHIGKLVAAGILLSLTLPALAQDSADEAPEEEVVFDENTADCISLRNVRRTEVVDDRNVLFYMRGKVVYHNILPRNCGGLARQDRFSYQTSIGRLCYLDHIRVLYDDPFGLREGNRCSLGVFHKIDSEDAKAFKEGVRNNVPAANPLPMPPPEDVGNNDEN